MVAGSERALQGGQLAQVGLEPARREEVEHPRGRVGHVREGVDDPGRHRDERAGPASTVSPPAVSRSVPVEHVERVVPSRGGCAAAGRGTPARRPSRSGRSARRCPRRCGQDLAARRAHLELLALARAADDGSHARHHPPMCGSPSSRTPTCPRKSLVLPPACLERLRDADLILHAGDWSSMDAVAMVRGDRPAGGRGARERGDARGARRAAGHRRGGGRRVSASASSTTAGPATDGSAACGGASRRRTPWSSATRTSPGTRSRGTASWSLNPGSPTERRRSPRHSMAEIEVEDGRIAAVAFWAVDDPAGPLDPDLVGSGPR